LREYVAQEAPRHIGERATVVGKVDCIGAGRTYHYLQLNGCSPNSPFWIIVNNDASGPELDVHELQDVTIAVTGKIERQDTQPWIVVSSTTQIVPRTPKQTNYIGHAYDKEQKGDIDGAIADLNKAIEHQLARRDEACEHLARIKEKRGDWAGALAAYDRLVSFDPNKAGSYWVRATAKEQHGDFEGAMADFTRAAELRSSGANFIEIGNRRKAHGDLTGATATYDKAIAMLDSQIAGTTKPSDRLDLLFYQRGYAKELKGDIEGAVADYGRAIATKPSYEAGAYSRRGDIKKARGDLAGAVADYQYAVKYAQLPEDKEKLRRAQAEANQKHQQSFNKTEVTPESVAAAFVQAYSGADVEAVGRLYADRVDYTNSGVISNTAIRKQAQEYFARWPVRQWSLAGPVKTTSMGLSRQKVIFSASYDASDPQTNKHASGIAIETLIVASDASGAMKIVSQREQTSKEGSSRSNEETSADPGLKAAKAEYEASSHDEATRVRYVTKLADIYYQSLQNDWATGEKKALEGGDLVFEELTKHPAPADSDSKKLSQLLAGEWAAPRHGNPYVFRADGKWGRSGGPMDESWQIKGNQYFAWDATGKIDDSGTIILLNDDYFIYSDRDHNVTFYARFQKALADAKRIQKQAEAASQQTPPDKVGNVEGAVLASAETAETQEFEAAKQEYEQSTHDESARSAYVTKLAKIRHRQIRNYWKTGGKNFDLATTVNEELRKHPAPTNSDSKKMSQFLIGTWQSPRHAYVFRANGKYGMEDGPISSNWRIKGNQLIEGSSSGTIILLNADYFIYSEGEAVFFHSRVK
jgi:tetratricopeptide (TPR) repeat protein